MGTNFYLFSTESNGGTHIGKRSGAGLYCWDCNITLCIEGNKGIHLDKSEWYRFCPKCCKEKKKESLLDEIPYGLAERTKQGVETCCSFSWAIEDPVDFIVMLKDPIRSKNIEIFDENNKAISRKNFLKIILEDCPIKYYDSIGEEFS